MPSFHKILSVTVVAVLVLASGDGEDWRQWLYPLASDGLILSASLVMLVRRLLSLPSGILAWSAFGAGIAASADTNVAHAIHQGGDAVVLAERVVVSAWPTLVLLVAHEMLVQLVAHVAGEKPRRSTPPRPFLPCRQLPPFLGRRHSAPPYRRQRPRPLSRPLRPGMPLPPHLPCRQHSTPPTPAAPAAQPAIALPLAAGPSRAGSRRNAPADLPPTSGPTRVYGTGSLTEASTLREAARTEARRALASDTPTPANPSPRCSTCPSGGVASNSKPSKPSLATLPRTALTPQRTWTPQLRVARRCWWMETATPR